MGGLAVAAVLAVDTNVLIYFMEADPQFGPLAHRLLQQVAAGSLEAVGSELLYIEVLSHRALSNHDVTRVTKIIEASGVKMIPIHKSILLQAAQLRRTTPTLKTPDAIHLATAQFAGAGQFVTNDQELLKRNVEGIELISLTHTKERIVL